MHTRSCVLSCSLPEKNKETKPELELELEL